MASFDSDVDRRQYFNGFTVYDEVELGTWLKENRQLGRGHRDVYRIISTFRWSSDFSCRTFHVLYPCPCSGIAIVIFKNTLGDDELCQSVGQHSLFGTFADEAWYKYKKVYYCHDSSEFESGWASLTNTQCFFYLS